jgi:hypothetical protein
MRAAGWPPDGVADATRVPDEWVRALSADGVERERATARLHEMLLRVARAEAHRRSGQFGRRLTCDVPAGRLGRRRPRPPLTDETVPAQGTPPAHRR